MTRLPKRCSATRTAVTLSTCAVAAFAGGCGGAISSSHTGSPQSGSGGTVPATAQITPAQKAHATPATSNPDAGSAQAQVAPTESAPSDSAKTIAPATHSSRHGASRIGRAGQVQKARPTPASSNDDVNTTTSTQTNPCSLVSLREAESVAGAAVTGQVEAPLGPTCIYRSSHAKRDITLAVEPLNFSQVTQHLPKRTSVTVAGREAYCGRLGTEVLYFPLAGRTLLTVTAPCRIAQRFAAIAAGHLAE